MCKSIDVNLNVNVFWLNIIILNVKKINLGLWDISVHAESGEQTILMLDSAYRAHRAAIGRIKSSSKKIGYYYFSSFL